ncbi:PucR family transcriptional regulator [Peribacillus frigoritolerans]|uniref:PucR family transcriptional regulator n=1 Tax=Peribacillus frigoritolerans TaxID=450367 RepID=UPI003D0105E6
MDVTLKDLMNLKIFEGMELIAGEKGLSRKITDCGILDYEFDRSLKNRYFHSNFHEHQLALSTFLYAKDDDYLINDAIKHLVKKEASGLAIKNIYRLPIHDSALRYAESMNFPIFIIDPTIFFEDIIISIEECIQMLGSSFYGQKEIDTLLYKSLDQSNIKQHALQINPSLKNNFFIVYFYFKNNFDNQLFLKVQTCFKNSKFNQPSISLLRFNNGFILLYSKGFIDQNDKDFLLTEIIHSLLDSVTSIAIGVSDLHYRLEEIKQAIQESFYAALLHNNLNSCFLPYRDIGTFKAIFPFANSEPMEQFSQRYLNPLRDFDAENTLLLLDTLTEFIKCNGNLRELSIKLSLHENTLRYRLEKIAHLTGLNFKKPEHYEQLSLAVKVQICTDLLNEFGIL